MMAPPTYYDLLGVSADATSAEVRKAYLKAAAASHPDKNPDAPKHVFQLVGEAYQCLSDPAARRAYDTKLRDPFPGRFDPGTPPRSSFTPQSPFPQPRYAPPPGQGPCNPPRPRVIPSFFPGLVHRPYYAPRPFVFAPRPRPRPPPSPFGMPPFVPRVPPPPPPPPPPPHFAFFAHVHAPRSHVPAFPAAAARAQEIESLLRRHQAELEAFLKGNLGGDPRPRPFPMPAEELEEDFPRGRPYASSSPDRSRPPAPSVPPAEPGLDNGRTVATPENTAHPKECGGAARARARSTSRGPPAAMFEYEAPSTRATPGVQEVHGFLQPPAAAFMASAGGGSAEGSGSGASSITPEDGRTIATPFNTAHLKQDGSESIIEPVKVSGRSSRQVPRSQTPEAPKSELAKRVQEVCKKWGVSEDELLERLAAQNELQPQTPTGAASSQPQYGAKEELEVDPPREERPPAPAIRRQRAVTPPEASQCPPSPTPSWETAFTRFPNTSGPIEQLPPQPATAPIPPRRTAGRSVSPRPAFARAQQSAPERRHLHHSIPRKRSSQTMRHASSPSSPDGVDEWGMPLRPMSEAELNRDLPPLPGLSSSSAPAERGGYLSSVRRLSKNLMSRKR